MNDPEHKPTTLRFDEFELDGGQRRLLRSGDEVHISPKALQLLTILVERAPNAVSKQELYDAIWPNVFVSETNLPGIAVELRNALGDDARAPRYLRTVHGYGYAFSAPVQAAPAPRHRTVRFRMLVQGREIAIGPGETTIGRSPDADVFVDHSSVSREHARIADRGESAEIEDLGSKNGTFVNGTRVSQSTPLHDNDIIVLGTVSIVFRDLGAAQRTVTVHRSDPPLPSGR